MPLIQSFQQKTFSQATSRTNNTNDNDYHFSIWRRKRQGLVEAKDSSIP